MELDTFTVMLTISTCQKLANRFMRRQLDTSFTLCPPPPTPSPNSCKKKTKIKL